MVKFYELGKKEPIINTDKILNEVMEELEEDMYMVAEKSTIEPKPIDYLECIFCKKLTPIYRIMSIPVCSTCWERRGCGSVYGLKRGLNEM